MPLRSTHVAGVAAAAFLVLVPAAPAAAPWADPQPLAGGHLAAWESNVFRTAPAQLGFTQGGVGFAVVGRDAGGLGYTRFSGTRGAFGAVNASGFGGIEPSQMALYGRSGVVLAGSVTGAGARRNPGNGVPLDVGVSLGNVTGRFASRLLLAKGLLFEPDRRFGQPAVVTALATNAARDAAVTVSYPVANRARTADAGFRNRLFVRARGAKTFRRTLDYGRQTVGSSPSALAFNGVGDLLLAWDDRQAVRARVISAGGKIAKEQRLGTGGSAYLGRGSVRLVAAIDSSRRMLVAWLAQRAGTSGNAGGPGLVAAAVASPSKPFGPQRTLESGLPTGEGALLGGVTVQAAILRDRSVVAWDGWKSGTRVVRTADLVRGRVEGTRQLSDVAASSSLRGMAVGPRGGTVVVWAARDAGLIAAPRAAGTSTWGAAETVTTAADGSGMTSALVAGSPVSGDTVVLASAPVVPPPGPIPAFSVRRPGA